MERKDLSANLKLMKAKIAEIEAKRQPRYITCSKYIASVGAIKDLESLRECAKALKVINNHFDSETVGVEEIGINPEDIKQEQNFLGFQREEWIQDLKQRVSELREAKLLVDLKQSVAKLSKHRTGDDIFQEDADGIDNLLELCK